MRTTLTSRQCPGCWLPPPWHCPLFATFCTNCSTCNNVVKTPWMENDRGREILHQIRERNMHELPVHEGKTERPRVQPNTHEQDRRPRSEGDARFRLPRPSQGRLLRCIQPQHHLRAPSRGSLFGSITERRRQENPKEGKNADPNLNLNDAHGPCPFRYVRTSTFVLSRRCPTLSSGVKTSLTTLFRRTNYQYYVAGVKQDSAERILGGGSLDLPFNQYVCASGPSANTVLTASARRRAQSSRG